MKKNEVLKLLKWIGFGLLGAVGLFALGFIIVLLFALWDCSCEVFCMPSLSVPDSVSKIILHDYVFIFGSIICATVGIIIGIFASLSDRSKRIKAEREAEEKRKQEEEQRQKAEKEAEEKRLKAEAEAKAKRLKEEQESHDSLNQRNILKELGDIAGLAQRTIGEAQSDMPSYRSSVQEFKASSENVLSAAEKKHAALSDIVEKHGK